MLFKKKTVEKIVAGFNQMMADLHEVIDKNTDLVLKKEQDIMSLRGEIQGYQEELARAAHIKAKLKDIVGGN
jgi:hypothetical protein